MTSFFFGFAAFWILLGVYRLRRAYVGERREVLVTLSRPGDLLMSRRDRIMSLSLGIISFVIGLVYLWGGLRRIV
jgi:hypothetical protein